MARPPDRVVAGVLRAGDRVLLCHRAPGRRWYPNVWDLPGGHIEPGEGALAALVRELREELGVEVQAVSSEPVARISGPGLTLQVYEVSSWEGRVQNCCPEEHDRVEWFALASVDSLDLDPALLGLLRDRPREQ